MGSVERVVGIDLGTTYSVVACLDDTGKPMTLRNAEGDLTTPTVVLFDDEEVVVGKEAVKAIAREPERVADCAKRDMGQPAYHRPINGVTVRPEVIQAYVLHKLKSDAAAQIGPFKSAIITVPAYFDEVRRKATQDAGYMAGLQVLDIVNEPVAAALACGMDRGFLSRSGASRNRQMLMVYDLGGGTFDVTVMAVTGSEFTTIATGGDVRLGGRDWDDRLCEFVAGQFAAAYGFDPRVDLQMAAALWRECEDAKRTLSSRQKVIVPCDFRGCSLPVEVTRDQFYELTMDLLERTEFTTREVLREAGLDWGSIDRLLMVGGATRMPMVAEMLERLSGKPVERAASLDEAVAHGAAIQAGLISDKRLGRKPRFSISNVNSHSLGLVGRDPSTGEKRTSVLMPRNTRIPAEKSKIFLTRAGQRSLRVDIVEGESLQPDACTQIGTTSIKSLPRDLPAQSPVVVTFAYATNGRIAVRVHIPGTSHDVHLEIERSNGMSQEELDWWRKRITGE